MADKPLIIVTRRLPDAVERRMAELFNVRLNASDAPFSRADMVAAASEAEILVPTVTDRIDRDLLLAAGPQLRLIASFSNGVDHIDVTAAGERRIVVTNTPGALTEDTADMTMALILAVPRRMIDGARIMLDDGRWAGWSPTWMLGRRLGGKKLGIVGMGRIGTALARRARAFGLSIHYHNRKPVSPETERELEATYWPSLDQMLAAMDIVSINCPQTPATYHLLSARRLKLLQPHAYLVNTARGSVVDEAALAAEIESGGIAGAGLDVFEGEPVLNPALHRLVREGRVVVLPHMGSATIEGRLEMGEKVIVNIRTFLDGHRPPNRILSASL